MVTMLFTKFQLPSTSGSVEEDFFRKIKWLPSGHIGFQNFMTLTILDPLGVKDHVYKIWSQSNKWFLRRSRKCEKFTPTSHDDGRRSTRDAISPLFHNKVPRWAYIKSDCHTMNKFRCPHWSEDINQVSAHSVLYFRRRSRLNELPW